MAFTPPPGKKTGLIKRNYGTHPSGCYASAPSFPDELIMPKDKQIEELRKQQEAKSSLLDIRNDNYDYLKSLDQDGLSLCWCFSTTKAVMYLRKLMGLPNVVLSAWYVAGMLNNWRDQGGWGAASLDFIAENGVPSIDKCPSYHKSSVTSDAAENAKLHRVTEFWDGTEDPERNKQIAISCWLRGDPCVVDLNSIEHSMNGVQLVSIDPFVFITDNSWNDIDQYGPKGTYLCKGRDSVINGLAIPRVTGVSTI